MTGPANGNGYGRYSFYASVAVVIFSVVGAVIWVGGLASEIEANKAALNAQQGRIVILERDLKTNDLQTSTQTRDLREIETQFCASDIVRNLMHANDMRQLAMIWRKVFGEVYPTDNAFYPQICNRPIAVQ